jgi:hypothetical protein
VPLGGFSWAPNPGFGELTLNDEFIELTEQRQKPKELGATIVKVFLPAIASVEVTSESVAKSKVGAVLLFGVLGGLAAKGSRDRGVFLVHLKNGQTGYFTIDGYSEHELRAKLSPWLNAMQISLGAPSLPAPAASTSVADELAKLAGLRDQGILTEDEFSAQKAKLLG